ncbi:alpha/beta hydrolase [Maricaulis sp. D1M11]|uniref:alpha/beta hydrolase n=1 Tax=Maricaulis sp. D1M11 TaxID=3076117 RepID=UPI0039B5D03D
MSLRVFSLLVLMGLSVTACAGTPPLAVIPPGSGDGQVERILVVTTREQDADPLLLFNEARAAEPHYAQLDVWVPHDRAFGQIRVAGRRADPDRHFGLSAYEDLQSSERFNTALARELATLPEGQRNIWLFVHGYNTSFSNGIFLQAQMMADFGNATFSDHRHSVAVQFAWPSAGTIPGYLYDRDSVQYSRSALADTLIELHNQGADDITVLAHSMGTLLTMEAIRQLDQSGRQDVIAHIAPLILAAPDIDVNVFQQQLRDLEHRPDPMVVALSREDRALLLSDMIRGGHARVGNGGDIEALNAEGMVVLDLTNVRDDRDPVNHTVFASSPTLLSLVESGALDTEALRDVSPTADGGLDRLFDFAAGIIYLPARTLTGD